MLSVRINAREDDADAGDRFLAALRIWNLAESLGGVDSLAELPSKMYVAFIKLRHIILRTLQDSRIRLCGGQGQAGHRRSLDPSVGRSRRRSRSSARFGSSIRQGVEPVI